MVYTICLLIHSHVKTTNVPDYVLTIFNSNNDNNNSRMTLYLLCINLQLLPSHITPPSFYTWCLPVDLSHCKLDLYLSSYPQTDYFYSPSYLTKVVSESSFHGPSLPSTYSFSKTLLTVCHFNFQVRFRSSTSWNIYGTTQTPK